MKTLWIRRRALALGALTMLIGVSAFAVQYASGMRASAADCSIASTCTRPTPVHAVALRQAARTQAARNQVRRRKIARRLIAAQTKRRAAVRSVHAATPPTTCAGVVAGIAWPAGWRVQCDGPRAGLLGATQPGGITDLFVRSDETMAALRVVALHEAGHAWDFARLGSARIERWCATRGCDASTFFSGSVSPEGWAEPSGAEDWAAVWDACHGGEYHRSYMGFAAPGPPECTLQNTLVDYPS